MNKHGTRAIAPLVALLVSYACPRPAHAADPIVGLRSLAMGDSLRGAASGAEGLLLNPSGIALYRQYAITGFYGLRVQDLGHQVHVSIADSVTQARIAVGLYYNFIYESPQVAYRVAEGTLTTPIGTTPGTRSILITGQTLTRTGHEVGLVTAFPLGDHFILGLTTKYGYFSTNTQLPTSQLPANFTSTNPSIDKNNVYDLGSLSNVVSFDIGMTIRTGKGLNIGLVGQNLWGHGDEMPTLLGVGLAYVPSNRLTIAADATTNFTGNQLCVGTTDPQNPCTDTKNRITVRVGGGLEYSIADKVPLRVGYVWDSNLNAHYVTGGLGYFNPRYAFDFALKQQASGGRETIFVIGFRLFRD